MGASAPFRERAIARLPGAMRSALSEADHGKGRGPGRQRHMIVI